MIRALEIHDRVLTVDTHADTPLRMIEPGFDMAKDCLLYTSDAADE